MSGSARTTIERPKSAGYAENYAARGVSPDGSINAAITTPITAATMLNAINAVDADFKVATRIASASRAAVVATIDASNTS